MLGISVDPNSQKGKSQKDYKEFSFLWIFFTFAIDFDRYSQANPL